ncbi:hypothetical protein F2Q68_00040351 [Brassica cretica]|uniref:Pectate lyase n=1 Tax=Brassica cretica TaxID=69181 RepID=A0A8S9MLF0_BRACR|nr:hypothetical protein F2Q68_00040351 [Brassica cretica]
MQTTKLFISIVSFLLYAHLILSSPVPDPEAIVEEVHKSINASVAGRRKLGYLSCTTGNPIDDCWRCDPHWETNRQRLADCAIGFGKNAIGGRDGRIYVVTDSGNDDPVTPKPGTLRHAVVQDEPLWIIFQRDMTIQLKEELIMNSFKTIDGRGASVHIAGGPCITIQYVTNIIIHGIHIHDCKPGGNAMVRSSPRHYGWRTISDGDGVSIFGGSHVWVDHCSLSNCEDGLIDAIMGSTAITLSNNYMTHHDKVMLLGHSDTYTRDKNMQITIAFNHFAKTNLKKSPFVSFVAQNSDWEGEEGGDASASVAVEENDSEGEGDVSGGGDFPEPPEEAKLFVGNLAYDVDSQALAMLFEQAGTVEIAEVIYNRETDQSRGFGFVTMSTVEEAETAVEKFNRYDLNGRLLTVNKAAPRGSRPERQPRVYEPAFRVYVGNLPWDVDNGRLEQVFSEHGKVVEARVVYDRETGRSRGFGFVTMSNETELNDAIAALDGQNMKGRAIRVNVAEERPRREF